MELIDEIEEKLRDGLKPVEINIWDESNEHKGHPGATTGASHFFLRIISEKFEGLNRIQRHKMVYSFLDGYIPEKIHAISIQALSTKELKD